MPRHYVDNAMNRSLGRVGMEHGTAVHSRSSTPNYNSSSSSGVYVDNAMNRSLGRVGMEHGTAVNSRSSTPNYNSSSSSGVYVDNAMNRSLGRVGMEHGTAVHSRSSTPIYNSSSSSGVYVDNAMNRSLGRVGLPLGSAVHSSKGYSPSESVDGALNHRMGRVGLESATRSKTPRTYVDNAYNRRLGRVGLPLGSVVVSKSGISSVSKENARTYVDNALNRQLGCVGKPLGSVPVSKLKCNPNVFDFNRNIYLEELDETLPDDVIEEVENLGMLNQARSDAIARKDKKIELKPEQIIQFNELELGDKIGSGGFGDVHIAFWKGQQVAVKKLRVQRVTQARKKQFEDEVRGFTGLDHPNIVKFYGACVVTPNLALVMEFMPDGSLYDNLHYFQEQFDEKTKNQFILDYFLALEYIHRKNIVHRDVKSKNILLFDNKKRCKLADFGLALKDEMESNASTKTFGFAGTVKYCPKEVVDGQELTIEQLKLADVYSLALTTVELLTEQEPFNKCRGFHQIRAAITNGEIPEMEKSGISTDNIRLLKRALSSDANQRPSAAKFLDSFNF